MHGKHMDDQLNIEDLKALLGKPQLPGSPEELEVLMHWARQLARRKGEHYIRKNRKRLFRDWKDILHTGLSRI